MNEMMDVVMKKAGLIIGILLLALTPAARGGLVFTVNGTEMPDGSTIVLGPSDVIELDLEISEGHDIAGYALGYTLTNPNAEFITTGGYGYGSISFPTIFDFPGEVYINEPQYVEIAARNLMEANPGPRVLMKDLLIHKLDSTYVELIITAHSETMIDGKWIPDGTLLYTLHIVPEPATIFIVGLGGLMLHSRKKKQREYKSNADA